MTLVLGQNHQCPACGRGKDGEDGWRDSPTPLSGRRLAAGASEQAQRYLAYVMGERDLGSPCLSMYHDP